MTKVKDIIPNIILMLLGILTLLLEFNFLKLNGAIGLALTTTGVLFIGAGLLYKSKHPIKLLAEFFMNLF